MTDEKTWYCWSFTMQSFWRPTTIGPDWSWHHPKCGFYDEQPEPFEDIT